MPPSSLSLCPSWVWGFRHVWASISDIPDTEVLADVLDTPHLVGYDKDMNKEDRVPGNGRGAKGFVDIERARDMHDYHEEDGLSYKEIADMYGLTSRQGAQYIIQKYKKHLEEEAKDV